jgi:hypothetical protein
MAMPFSGLVLGLLLLLSMASPASLCNEQEKASLLQFLPGLSQDNGLTASWQNDTDCCEWEGITCCRDGAVVEVSLLPEALKAASHHPLVTSPTFRASSCLTTPSLAAFRRSCWPPVASPCSFNHLRGGLQLQESYSSVSNYSRLQVLNISSNLFTGELPYAAWEKTSNLVVLNASNNNFRGLMPSSFCISGLLSVYGKPTHSFQKVHFR